MVTDDVECAARHHTDITEDMWKGDSGDALSAAFYHVTNTRFADKSIEDIVSWVAALRTRLGDDADEIDPRYAEWMIRGAVRDELDLVQKIGPDAYIPLQLLLTAQLVAQQNLSAEELEAFLLAAEGLAARWGSE
jgi:hypothetical protein